MSHRIVGLYVIADTSYLDNQRLVPTIRAAIEGGANVVQYRDKSNNVALRERQASELAELCRKTNTAFLINDDVALAEHVNADGVHIGGDDAPIAQCRAHLGPHAIIGVSCYNDFERARAAQSQGANYVAFGSFYASHTKPNAARASLELLRAARNKIHIPIVAIGGINAGNGLPLIECGADALAVIEAVIGQSDARVAAEKIAHLFEYEPVAK